MSLPSNIKLAMRSCSTDAERLQVLEGWYVMRDGQHFPDGSVGTVRITGNQLADVVCAAYDLGAAPPSDIAGLTDLAHRVASKLTRLVAERS